MSLAIPRKSRGRNGCLTCRVRKIKCDELRPRCNRCISTGRTCDGYEHESQAVRDAAKRGKGKRPLMPLLVAKESESFSSIPAQLTFFSNSSAVEGQNFVFFREHTLQEIPGSFESSCWESLVLQLSLHEPSVRHAAVAVGALHRSMKGRCPSLQIDDYIGCANSFALKQYVKSLNQLRRRLSGPRDSDCEHVALVTCLLLICFEMLQGNRPGAVAHLRMGIRILMTIRSSFAFLPEESQTSVFDTCRAQQSTIDKLADTYARLDYESTMFGEKSPILTLGPSSSDMGPSLQVPSFFMNLVGARKSLNILSNAVYRLRGELLHLAASEMVNKMDEDWAVRYCKSYSRIRTVNLSKHPLLLHQRSYLEFALERWATAFKVLTSSLVHHDARPMISLEMQHFYVYFLICTLRDTHEEICDYFDPAFEHVVGLGERYLHATSSKNLSSPSNFTFTLESGIIPPLYLVAMKCRNKRIRHDAIALLDRTRCQEGMWEGGLVARFVAEIAKSEEEAASTEDGGDFNRTFYIHERARFSDVVIAMSETPGYGRLVCARYAHELAGMLEISQKTFRFDTIAM